MGEVIVGLAIVLAVVTVLGHGLWVLAAMAIRAITGRPLRQRPAVRPCLACGQPTSAERDRCDWCGVSSADPRWAEIVDHAAFVRQLRRLERSGAMTRDEVENLLSRAETQRRDSSTPNRTATVSERRVEEIAKTPIAPLPGDRGSVVEPPAGRVLTAELVNEPAATGAAAPSAQPLPAPKPQRPPEPGAARPRRSWAELVETFMEERNMRWGELIGGLLIVGGGVALAISLRERLQEIPYSQFFIFALITAAIHGAGLYSHYRWRLATTSRGLLTIGLLLTPVSFLIMASLAGGDSRPITLGVEALGLALFGWLTHLAARILVPDRPWPVVLGTVGNSAAVLVLARLPVESLGPAWAAAVGLVPGVVLGGAAAGYLARRPERRWLDIPRSVGLMTLLGTSAFTWIVAEGHWLAELAGRFGLAGALDRFAVPLAVAGAVPLVAGLTLLRQTKTGPAREPYRAAGTTIALVAMTVLLAALTLAWPWPEMLLAVGLFNAAALAAAAIGYRMPILHAGTIFCAALVTLVGYHAADAGLFGQPLDQMGRQLLAGVTSAPSANLLGGLFVVSAVVAEWFVRAGRRRDARVYAIGCGALAAVGVSLVTWRGAAGGNDALRAAILYAVYGLISVGLAARWNKVALSYFGLALVQAAACWAAWWRQESFWLALAAFSTAATISALAARLALDRRPAAMRRHVERLIVAPCIHAALASAAVALPWLVLDQAVSTVAMAGHLAWLAALATALAFLAGRNELLAAAQAVWAIAALAAARAWIEQSAGWLWPDVRMLQAYGVALAAVGAASGAARLALRRNRAARRLFDPPWPAVDQTIHHVLVLAQWAVALACLLPHLMGEWGLIPGDAEPNLFGLALDVGPGAWLLVGLLTLGSALRLAHRFEDVDLVSLLVIIASVPGLVAGRFVGEWAVASAWRWALAAVFLAASTMVWSRASLAPLVRRFGGRIHLGPIAARLARGLLVGATAAPMIALSVPAVVLRISGTPPAGPLEGSFFERIGPEWSYLVPLAVSIFILVGYAARDRSAACAFAAGSVAEWAVVLGFVLGVNQLGTVEVVRLIQWVSIASAVWAIAWLLARRWTDAWDASEPGIGRTLWNLQLAEGASINTLLIAPALVVLGWAGPWLDPQNTLGSDVNSWLAAVGGPLGWIALLSCLGAIAYRSVQARRSVDPNFVALAGMTAVGLLSCTFFSLWPEWGFRSLMLGWAGYAVVVAAAAWWIASPRTAPNAGGRPQSAACVAATWVRLAGLSAVVLALWGSLKYDERLWAAGAIALASLAAATMAAWLRREGWALAAALGVNLAASLAVWHHYHDAHLVGWWINLVRANVIASGSVGLVWLAAVRRLYPLREASVRGNSLLTLQVAMSAAAQAVLCLLPVVQLVLQPESLPDEIAALGSPATWLAFVLAVAAAGWQSIRVSRGNIASVVAAALVGAAALAACHTTALADFGSYYFLTTTLAIVGLGIVAGGMIAERLADHDHAPRRAVAAWATAVGALVVFLSSIHCGEDPCRPWWFASTLLSVSFVAGLLAVWLRRNEYVWASGLVLCAAGTIVWYVQSAEGMVALLEISVLGLALGSTIWSTIGLALRTRLLGRDPNGSDAPHSDTGVPSSLFPVSYIQAAAAAALVGSLVLVAWRLGADVADLDHLRAGILSWVSLGATAVALAMLLVGGRSFSSPMMDRAAWGRPGLYLTGVAAIGLGLDARWLAGRQLAWTAAVDLAAFALAAALIGWGLNVWKRVRPSASKRHDEEPVGTDRRADSTANRAATARPFPPNLFDPRLAGWFSRFQQLVVGVAAVLSVWISIDGRFDLCAYSELRLLAGRVAGPIAAAVLLAAALAMVRQTLDKARREWQIAALLLISTVLATAGWWRLGADGFSPWLHRTVVLLAAAALGAIGSGLIALRSTKGRGDWLAGSRAAARGLGGLALVALVCALGLEFHLYVPDEGTPMAVWAMVTVAVALVGLAVGLVVAAVAPGTDPKESDLRAGTIYVYGAELICVLLGVHLRLVEPWLFQLGIIERYWIYLVMGAAFLGAGLAEWFHRRRADVLAEPLERTAMALPLAAAIGFWFLPDASPAFWFLTSLFYGVMAIGRRNRWLGLASVATGNLGLWVLWNHAGLHFVDRPQLWLIPAALCALVAERLHHDRLDEGQSAAIRYMALSVIYVSSTVEFLRGLGESVWLPLVLVGLSLAGVFAGIVFRVRSFLYLGVTFLLVVLVRMILYAAFEQGQMWIFWSACVCLGGIIIGLFAVFEKRRNDVLAALQRFKRWEP